MAKKKSGYAVWYRGSLRDAAGQVVGSSYVERHTGADSLEFARSLTQDLTRMHVPWRIVDNRDGTVIEEFKGGD